MGRTIALATLVAGTLDILFAMLLTVLFGREIASMLRYVGSGPFPAAIDMGTAGAMIGLLTHFGLMAIMATIYAMAARSRSALLRSPVQWGVLYGLATYVAMNLIVVPLRFEAPLPPSARAIATQLFAHVVLVGIPIALIAARNLKPKAFA
jgi:hypothetical protein